MSLNNIGNIKHCNCRKYLSVVLSSQSLQLFQLRRLDTPQTIISHCKISIPIFNLLPYSIKVKKKLHNVSSKFIYQ